MNPTSSYPLSWPVTSPRTPEHQRGAGPNQMPAGRIRQRLAHELKMLGVSNVVISTDVAVRRDGLPYAGQAAPKDPGVVLYFTRHGDDIAMACDRWRTVNANLRAICLNLEAIRGMERWGVNDAVDRAFRGYKALPESAIVTPYTARSWHEVLEVAPTASHEVIRAAYRRLLMRHHPDQGGDEAKFHELQQAYKESGASS